MGSWNRGRCGYLEQGCRYRKLEQRQVQVPRTEVCIGTDSWNRGRCRYLEQRCKYRRLEQRKVQVPGLAQRYRNRQMEQRQVPRTEVFVNKHNCNISRHRRYNHLEQW